MTKTFKHKAISGESLAAPKREIHTMEQLEAIASGQLRTIPPAALSQPAAEPEKLGEGRGRGRPKRTEELVTFNLRLPASVVEEIDRRRGGLASRNAWIAMVIGEKLKTP